MSTAGSTFIIVPPTVDLLPASALQPEGPWEMFDAVLVLILVINVTNIQHFRTTSPREIKMCIKLKKKKGKKRKSKNCTIFRLIPRTVLAESMLFQARGWLGAELLQASLSLSSQWLSLGQRRCLRLILVEVEPRRAWRELQLEVEILQGIDCGKREHTRYE